MAYRLLIDGELVAGDLTLPVVNPATGKIWTDVPRASVAQAERAIAAARTAQPAWAATELSRRQAGLSALADAVEARAEAFARAIVTEQGKPLAEATAEVGYAVFFLRAFAAKELPVEVVRDDADLLVEVHQKPLGVVAGITPWNFPLLIASYKLAPALLLGNTFVLKPAPTTPVSALMLAEAAAPIFPRGVVNVLVDDNDLGPLLTAHPDVAKVTFTGSTATGKRVMASSAETLKRVTLELGGNDAAIVLEDADVANIAPKLFGSAFLNSGQVCIAVKRVYAHRSLYDPLCDELGKLAEAAVVGDGLEQGVTMGPLQNAAQFEKAQHYLDIARRDGTIVASGSAPDGRGYFVPPTIVRDISPTSPLVTEEQFAPVLPVIPFDDVSEVVRDVNAGEYGLGGSVWTADVEHARKIAAQIDAGTVWINHHLHFDPDIPFPGAKASGIGVEFGTEGLGEFSQTAVVSIARQG